MFPRQTRPLYRITHQPLSPNTACDETPNYYYPNADLRVLGAIQTVLPNAAPAASPSDRRSQV